MRNKGIRHVVVFFLVVAALFTGTTFVYAATGRQLADSAIAALKASAVTSTTRNVVTIDWSWLEVNFYDEQYPLTVDVVGSNFQTVKKVIYLLPGGGVNFRSSFFTPIDNNLAQFLRTKGYLVIGITPREDKAPAGMSSMTNWGLAMHKQDITKVISTIQSRINKKYRVLGHSFGAVYALDYASTCEDPLYEKVIALDIYSFDHSPAAVISYGIFEQAALQEPYADASFTDTKSLALVSLLLPKIDSGESRGAFGPGNFTWEGLFYFSLINTRYVSGVDILEWPLEQSYAAGKYYPARCPLFDTYYLTKSDINTVRSMIFMIGSGLIPYAVYRDVYDVNGYNDGSAGHYSIKWADWKNEKPVIWLNTALGFNWNMAGAYQVPDDVSVTTDVIPEYGHLDILLSRTAQRDVWGKYHLDN